MAIALSVCSGLWINDMTLAWHVVSHMTRTRDVIDDVVGDVICNLRCHVVYDVVWEGEPTQVNLETR